MLALAFTATQQKRKDRLGSYPCVSLYLVLASGHEKSRIYGYFRVMQARQNVTHVPLRYIVNQLALIL